MGLGLGSGSGCLLDLPAFRIRKLAVFQRVMSSAEMAEVLSFGGAAVLCCHRVIDIAGDSRHRAAGKPAVLISCAQQMFEALRWAIRVDREHASGVRAGEDAIPPAAGARDAAGSCSVDGAVAFELCRAGVWRGQVCCVVVCLAARAVESGKSEYGNRNLHVPGHPGE